MAIAFDAFTDGGGKFAAETSLTYSHTCTGSNRILVVAVRKITNYTNVTGITYGGTALTQAIEKPWPPNAATGTHLWYLFAPASGANNVVVTVTDNPGQFTSACGSYTGAAQSGTPNTGFRSANETGDAPVTVNVSTANSWLVLGSYVSADADPTAVLAGTTARTAVAANPSYYDSNGAVGSGNQTIGLTWGATDRHILIALAFAPTSTVVRRVMNLSLLGVG